MKRQIYNKGVKEFKKIQTGKPTKFDIWWYGYEVWKYAWGFIFGLLFMEILIISILK